MLDYVEGKLVKLEPNFAIIDVGGWGLRLSISILTYNKIKTKLGKKLKLYTQVQIRDDSIEIYAFYDSVERQAFILLNKVPGIGPKVAIAVLSILNVEQLKSSIISEDVKSLTMVPGIGKKTAQKIIFELKDHIKSLPVNCADSNIDIIFEAKEALMSLGFNSGEIKSALDDISAENAESVEDVIKAALKNLSR